MVELYDRKGDQLFFGAFVRIHSLFDTNEFGEFEKNRKSSIGRIAKISQVTGKSYGVFWHDDFEIELEYRMITRDGISSMSIGAFGSDLEVVECNTEIEMLYDIEIWKHIDNFGEEQKTEYFSMLVKTFGYCL